MSSPAATFLDIRRSESERLRVTVSEYRGRTFVDFRAWYVCEDGSYKPCRAGLTLRPGQIPEICQSLVLAARAIDPAGVR